MKNPRMHARHRGPGRSRPDYAHTPACEGAPGADRPLEAVILKTAERPTAADRSAAPVPAAPPSRGKPAQRLW
jgi:hypothetical protein